MRLSDGYASVPPHLIFLGIYPAMTQLSYAAAGVDIDAGDELVDRIKPLAKKTLIPGVLALSLIHISEPTRPY